MMMSRFKVMATARVSRPMPRSVKGLLTTIQLRIATPRSIRWTDRNSGHGEGLPRAVQEQLPLQHLL